MVTSPAQTLQGYQETFPASINTSSDTVSPANQVSASSTDAVTGPLWALVLPQLLVLTLFAPLMDMGKHASSDSKVSIQGSSTFPLQSPSLEIHPEEKLPAGNTLSNPGDNLGAVPPSLLSYHIGLVGTCGPPM